MNPPSTPVEGNRIGKEKVQCLLNVLKVLDPRCPGHAAQPSESRAVLQKGRRSAAGRHSMMPSRDDESSATRRNTTGCNPKAAAAVEGRGLAPAAGRGPVQAAQRIIMK
eukprot:CAMPEP_0195083592 /NCGR_PEP_ID=MMETSP0448-20130528/24493_1 /TAXON_ID=66468 /ORGANISM="Heterocapsa triquestra, Strain CCMP 448" /LENGTH=108 /DNA_ID=CAMNT_0040116819 /DNA_START=74 /DNA_END=397 /DNA_ORIENTATION=-